MSHLLDCTNRETTIQSVAKILNIDQKLLIEVIDNINVLSDECHSEIMVSEIIYREFGVPELMFDAVWFHGTRTSDTCAFKQEGLLTKNETRNRIEIKLKSLAEGLVKNGEYPNSLSLSSKNTLHDEGPFAFLFRDVAIHAPGFNHSYVDAPELVEDISGVMLGANFMQLVERFKAVTSPYVIHFVAKADNYELSKALWYLYLMSQSYDQIKAVEIANTCFSGNGQPIHPENILKIEKLSSV